MTQTKLDFCLECGGYNAIADFSPWCGSCIPDPEITQEAIRALRSPQSR